MSPPSSEFIKASAMMPSDSATISRAEAKRMERRESAP